MFKKIIKSILNLFLVSATVHNCVLVFLSIKNGNIKYLNYFRILGLEEFWPKIAERKMSDLISIIIIVILTTFFLILEMLKINSNKELDKNV